MEPSLRTAVINVIHVIYDVIIILVSVSSSLPGEQSQLATRSRGLMMASLLASGGW